jgi:hypothetical protein
MAVSAGLYRSENWVLTEKDKNRIQAAEMRFLRSKLGVTRQNRLTNEAIKETLKVNSFNNTISKYRGIWLIMSQKWIAVVFARYMLSYKHTGKSNLGRPRKR